MAFKTLWIVLMALLASDVYGGPQERRLLRDILEYYNPLERPVYNESANVTLNFGLTIQGIDELDETNQVLTSRLWLNMQWNDINLRWEESEYGNIESIRLPTSKIWTPDIMLFNNADNDYNLGYPTRVIVSSNGNCMFVTPKVTKSTCKIDRVNTEYQTCDLKFGSWTYNGFKLDLQTDDGDGVDLSTFVVNEKWDLLSVEGKRNEIFYPCCPEPYLDITYKLTLKRKPQSLFGK